jgi:hypothetical protein
MNCKTKQKEDVVTLISNFVRIHPAVLMKLHEQTDRKLEERRKFQKDRKPPNCPTLHAGQNAQK